MTAAVSEIGYRLEITLRTEVGHSEPAHTVARKDERGRSVVDELVGKQKWQSPRVARRARQEAPTEQVVAAGGQGLRGMLSHTLQHV